jgi:hypothetical protein
MRFGTLATNRFPLCPSGDLDDVVPSFRHTATGAAAALARLKDPQRTPDGVLEVASLQDLLAHKLKVLLQRVEPKDYLDIDAMLQNGLDLAQGCAGAHALFMAFAPQECLKALTYFNDPSLEILSEPLKQRLVKAAAGVKSIPDVNVRIRTLSKR